MSYWITKFKDVTLPTRAGRAEVGVGPAFGSVRTLSGGGGFDPQGTRPVRRTPWRIGVEGTVVGADDDALVAACGSVRALLGQAGTLYRTPDGGTADSQWTWARCVDVSVSRGVPSRLHCPISLTFEVQSPSWYGTALVKTPLAVSTGNTALGIVNAGNAPVWDAQVQIKATGAITACAMYCTTAGYETHITFGGTIPSGGTLILHAGSLTVYNNGTPAFGGFAYGANAERPEWFILQPSATSNFTFSATGAGGTVTFIRYDAYA